MSDTTTGIIYKIICKLDHKFVYIGSTFDTLRNRWQRHKSHYKKWLSDPESINPCSCVQYFEKYGIENFKILEIKSYDIHLKDRRCLEAYETLWIRKTRGCCNVNLPIRYLRKEYHKQYHQDNCEHIAEYQKQYNQNNREKRAEYHKQYRQGNCEHIAEYQKQYQQNNRERILEYQKQYHQDNCESITEYHKRYRELNKEKIRNYRKVKIACQCGAEVTKSSMARHCRSKKHKAFLADL